MQMYQMQLQRGGGGGGGEGGRAQNLDFRELKNVLGNFR
jgi:hypothetical protein